MINFGCRRFRASRPCEPNLREGAECGTCAVFSPFGERVLIIKLGAAGDVVRTASILPYVISRHDRPRISWLTAPANADLVGTFVGVDEVIAVSTEGLAQVIAGAWDGVYSLSNDPESAALASLPNPQAPVVGFSMVNGAVRPSNPAAEAWLTLAAFNRFKQANTLTFQEHMAAIIGCGEPLPPPRLQLPDAALRAARQRVGNGASPDRPRLAINVGSGARWPKKMMVADRIAALIERLCVETDIEILLLGGRAEETKAQEIMTLCSEKHRIRPLLTPDSTVEFAAIVAQADAILTGDTLALHLATALSVPTIALFGPTSAAEIPDFDGLVVKLRATRLTCLGCYDDCDKAENCMSLLDLDELLELTKGQLANRIGETRADPWRAQGESPQ